VSIASTGASDWEKPGSRPGDPRRATGPPVGGIARVAYSIPETAKLLGVSDASVWRSLQRGQLDSFMFGGRRLIKAQSIERLVSAEATA
jgi:excisionase family DNA binding protein